VLRFKRVEHYAWKCNATECDCYFLTDFSGFADAADNQLSAVTLGFKKERYSLHKGIGRRNVANGIRFSFQCVLNHFQQNSAPKYTLN
jgi:hypothetical protein